MSGLLDMETYLRKRYGDKYVPGSYMITASKAFQELLDRLDAIEQQAKLLEGGDDET